ncbi:hypothetical protein ACLOJK_007244, partial [Asimina triloba]
GGPPFAASRSLNLLLPLRRGLPAGRSREMGFAVDDNGEDTFDQSRCHGLHRRRIFALLLVIDFKRMGWRRRYRDRTRRWGLPIGGFLSPAKEMGT